MSQINTQVGKSAVLVARYLILNSDVLLTPLHVDKLVFFSHGWYLGIFHRTLISDIVEAWKYGPVIPSVYHAFKKYGNDKIDPYVIHNKNKIDKLFTNNEKLIMNRVLKIYNKRKGAELIAITHVDDSPWSEYYIPNQHYTEIPNDAIKEYYINKVERNEKNRECS